MAQERPVANEVSWVADRRHVNLADELPTAQVEIYDEHDISHLVLTGLRQQTDVHGQHFDGRWHINPVHVLPYDRERELARTITAIGLPSLEVSVGDSLRFWILKDDGQQVGWTVLHRVGLVLVRYSEPETA